MVNSGKGLYVVPRGNGEGEPIVVDVTAIVKSEARLGDVAFVNGHTAPELLATFNDSWLKLSDSATMLTYERNQAENCWKRFKAEALLDVTPAKLKVRGHEKPSQDLREALMELDPRVIRAKDRLDEIRAVLDYLNGKAGAFLNAYNSVKKIVGTPSLPSEPPRDRPDTEVRERLTGFEPVDDDVFGSDSNNLAMPEGFEDPSYR